MRRVPFNFDETIIIMACLQTILDAYIEADRSNAADANAIRNILAKLEGRENASRRI